MKTPAISALLLVSTLLLVDPALGDDITLDNPVNCRGAHGLDLQVGDASCTDCNFGTEATIEGTVSGNCPGNVCLVATASAPLIKGVEELFKEDNFDCTGSFSRAFSIPDLPDHLKSVAMANIKIEFYSGGCEGGTLVGCSTIAAKTKGARVVQGVGVGFAITAAAAAGVAVWKYFMAGGVATATATTGGNFRKMDDGVV